ncbi:hypothetical protein NN561_019427 [Cricetulus griseus]
MMWGAGTYLVRPVLSRPRLPPVRRGSWLQENPPPGRLGSKGDLRPDSGRAGSLSSRSPRCWEWTIGVGSAAGARGRGCGGELLSGPPSTGCVPCLRRHRPVLSPPRGATGSGSSAGKARSEVRAKPPARLEIAPRPPGAPPPVRAPPHGGKRLPRWQGREGGNLFSDRSTLPGAPGRHTHARSAAPAAPLAARSEGDAAGCGRATAGGGAGLVRAAPGLGIPQVLDSGLQLGSTPQLLDCHCPGGGTE